VDPRGSRGAGTNRGLPRRARTGVDTPFRPAIPSLDHAKSGRISPRQSVTHPRGGSVVVREVVPPRERKHATSSQGRSPRVSGSAAASTAGPPDALESLAKEDILDADVVRHQERRMNKLLVARCLFTINAAGIAVGGFVADWNTRHIFNPNCPPHAKCHNGQTLAFGVLLASVGCASISPQELRVLQRLRTPHAPSSGNICTIRSWVWLSSQLSQYSA
jgi:hypothetical protein